MGIRIKEAPSGKEIVGSANGQILVWNNTSQRWDVGTPSDTGSPMPRMLFISGDSDPGGDGSATRAYKDPQEAIDNGNIDGTSFIVAPFDYTAGGPYVIDDGKNRRFIGTDLENQSTGPNTLGLALEVTVPGPGLQTIEVQGMNTHVNVPTGGNGNLLRLFGWNAVIRTQTEPGEQAPQVTLGGLSDTRYTAVNPDSVSILTMYGGTCDGGILSEPITPTVSMICKPGTTIGGFWQLSNNASRSRWSGCTCSAARVKVTGTHVLDVFNTIFLAPTVFLSDGNTNIRTDSATYANGVEAGVTWPGDTHIIDENMTIEPYVVAIGPIGISPAGNVTTQYGDCDTGDLFVGVFAVNNFQAAPTIAGWSPVYNVDPAALQPGEYIYTRDTRCTSPLEAGTNITFNNAMGNGLNSLVIYTVRHVKAGAIADYLVAGSLTTVSSDVGLLPGPTVPAAGLGKLALLFVQSVTATPPPDDISGSAGGTWITRGQVTADPNNVNLSVQTAVVNPSVGSVSGGGSNAGGGAIKIRGVAMAFEGTTIT